MGQGIVVTGASSGLGRALAIEYAAPGVALALIGRDPARLDEVVDAVRAKGAEATIGRIDVRDEQAMRAFLLAADDADPTECVIASAGVTMVTPRAGGVEDLTRCRDLFDVNLNGVMNMLAPLAPRMRARRRGQIALFGSIAAFAPPPELAVLCGQQGGHRRFRACDPRPLRRRRRVGERDLSRIRRHADDEVLRQRKALRDERRRGRSAHSPRA